MKLNLIILPIIALLIGCGTAKNVETTDTTIQPATDQTDQTEEVKEDQNQNTGQHGVTMSEGIVRDKSREGCGFVIEVLVDNVNNQSSYLEPLPLPEDYQVDGKAIRITYRMSGRPSTCTIANPIIIDKIVE